VGGGAIGRSQARIGDFYRWALGQTASGQFNQWAVPLQWAKPIYPFSFIYFFSNKFQSSGFKNTNHFLT
jgi:hypothetical protein